MSVTRYAAQVLDHVTRCAPRMPPVAWQAEVILIGGSVPLGPEAKIATPHLIRYWSVFPKQLDDLRTFRTEEWTVICVLRRELLVHERLDPMHVRQIVAPHEVANLTRNADHEAGHAAATSILELSPWFVSVLPQADSLGG